MPPPPPSARERPDLTPEEFSRLLEREVSNLDAREREILGMYAISTVRAKHQWLYGDRQVESRVWLIAMSGSVVIGYDEVEEEYGVGRLETPELHGDPIVEDWGILGERLGWTLRAFPGIIVSEPPLID